MDSNMLPYISLLWPDESAKELNKCHQELPDDTLNDLRISSLFEYINITADDLYTVTSILRNPCTDTKTLAFRQGIFRDLINNEELIQFLTSFAKQLDELVETTKDDLYLESAQEGIYVNSLRFLKSAYKFINMIDEIYSDYEKLVVIPSSEALLKFFNVIKEIFESTEYKLMKADAGSIKPELDKLREVTLGIHIFNAAADTVEVITCRNYHESVEASLENCVFSSYSVFKGDKGSKYADEWFNSAFPDIWNDLLHALVDHAPKTFKSICSFADRYNKFPIFSLLHLRSELVFYLSITKLFKHIASIGYLFCFPDIIAREEKYIRLENVYDLSLAVILASQNKKRGITVKKDIVANDCTFSKESGIYILTGPNSGGKTTFLRSIGISQVLFQSGCPIPAQSAVISPVNNVFTHFSKKEIVGDKKGRLGEEAARLFEIFKNMHGENLILLNETFSSTQARDGFLLGRDIIATMMEAGLFSVYVTHIHDLAYEVDNLNKEIAGGTRSGALTAGIDESTSAKRTYRITAEKYSGLSYARDIAAKHGMTWEQLTEKLAKKGVGINV